MRILFLHNNFPAQFGALGTYLGRCGWEVWFGTQRKDAARDGFKVYQYENHREVREGVHPYSVGWERAIITGQAAASVAIDLKKRGFEPDVVVAHSGWGPGLFVKDVWPDTKYVGYFEWYYNSPGPDVEFLDERDDTPDDRARSRARNAPILVDLATCDIGLCPTAWQKAQFPAVFDKKLLVHHDGVDTDLYQPSDARGLELPSVSLPPDVEIVTYVARGMEPYRGFPEFMAMLEKLQKRRANAHAVIVGDDRVAYGKKLAEGDSYKKRALDSLDLDLERVHFTGLLPRDHYRRVLLASSVHVYLTIPFVLSWSMMEAMSAGCLLVASDTPPTREMIADGESGLLVAHRDIDALADVVERALAEREALKDLRENARRVIVEQYSARRILPAKRALFDALATGLPIV